MSRLKNVWGEAFYLGEGNVGHNLTWFKLYSEIIHDPKIRRLSVDERWFWIVLLCLAAKSDDRHAVCVTREIGYELHEFVELCGYNFNDQINGEMDPREMIKSALIKFQKLGMIDVDENGVLYIKNFEKRQDTNLSEAERAKKYRDNKKKVTSEQEPSRDNVTTVTLDKKREEKNREEEKRINTPLPPKGVSASFEKFWKVYPKRKSKGQAEKTWNKLKPNEQLIAKILQAVERAKTSEDWRKDGGKFIPHPATWLNAEGWEDEHEVKLILPSNTSPRAPILQQWDKVDRGEISLEEGVPRGPELKNLIQNLTKSMGVNL